MKRFVYQNAYEFLTQGVIFCVQFNEDHSRLASASDDRSVRIWDLPLDWQEMKLADILVIM